MSDSSTRITMLENMLDALDFAVYTFDKDRKVIHANTAAKAALKGAVPGTSIGAAEEDHFKDNEYYDEDGNLLPYPKDSAVERALKGIETKDLVLEHRNRHTHTHAWVSISCTPVLDEHGNFEYGILSFRDISTRKSREDKLRFLIESTKILSITMEFKERLQKKASLTVPTLADWCAIDIAGLDGTIERVALVHRDPEKIEWIREYERKYPPPPGTESSTQRVIRTGVPEFVEVVTDEMIEAVPHLTDEQREAIRSLQLSSVMTIPMGKPGNVLGTLTLAYAESGRTYTKDDLSFFKEFAQHLGVLLENARLYRQIQDRDVAKDAFLASLSHELRNPLAPIKASIELLQLRDLDPTLKNEVDIIEHQFDHMARLLNDLLDSTRFVQGKIRLDMEHVDLVRVVAQAAHAAMIPARAAHVQLSTSLPEEPVRVHADRTRIEQAITNVLTNALKFTPAGGSVSVALSVSGKEAVVEVSDTGAGITKDELAQIFEPYYQSERVRNGNSGLGVGLRLVHEILQMHGGRVEARSAGPDLGSTFTLTVPLSEQEPMEEQDTDQQGDSIGKTRVLVVDDNQAAATGLVRLFSALGAEAECVYSAEEARVHLKEGTPDVALLDIGMPDMNGYDLIRILRSEGYDFPIVALTGYGLEEDKKRALEAGFTDHLTKPVGAKELRELLTAYGS